MEIKEPYRNNYYKVMEVTLNSGEAMPLHEAAYDAFIYGKKDLRK